MSSKAEKQKDLHSLKKNKSKNENIKYDKKS